MKNKKWGSYLLFISVFLPLLLFGKQQKPLFIPQDYTPVETLSVQNTITPTKSFASTINNVAALTTVEREDKQLIFSKKIKEIILPTTTPTLVPSPTPTQLSPLDLALTGKSYEGYWFKVTKNKDRSTYWEMKLLKQDLFGLTVVATFCVRGSDDNTPNGFYFIAIDRGTVYERARDGYNKVFFPHNFAFKLSDRNWYLHPAPWNDQGEAKCPVKSTGGCVNMRPEDFDIVLNGGEYSNPFTTEKTTIPFTGVGTPFVIVPEEETCDYLGNCLTAFKCKDGISCYHTYVCPYCNDFGTRWSQLVGKNPALKSLY